MSLFSFVLFCFSFLSLSSVGSAGFCLVGWLILVMALCHSLVSQTLSVFSKWGEDGGEGRLEGWDYWNFSFPSALRRKVVSDTSHFGFHTAMRLIVG